MATESRPPFAAAALWCIEMNVPPPAAAAFVHSLATRILDRTTGDAELLHACAALHEWALGPQPALSGTSIGLPSGLAIAPLDAARCLLDAARTACLARALDASIAARRARRPNERIEILYAGCGPLAPLALIAAARHRETPLRISLIDAHPESLRMARGVFERAGLAGLLGDVVCDDAARWRRPAAAPRAAILVAEVMQRALAREPQLAVVANLLPQCEHGTELIPARIGIELALAPLESLFLGASGAARHRLGSVLELSAAALPALCRALRANPTRLPAQSLQIPDDAPHGCHAVLLTCIDGGHGHALAESASGLTQPLPVLELGRVAPGETLTLCYRLVPEPGFEFARPAG